MSTATTQDQSKSPATRVIDHIAHERFTGLLRVHAREASGEFWFLAGILEEAQFGVTKGEEAVERLQRATELVFEADPRLPHFSGGFKKRMPASGTFADARPVALMRHCETFALTCLLELRGKDRTVRATYRMGELLSADAGSYGNEALPSLLESDEGVYEFVLPSFELPPGVNTALSLAPSGPAAVSATASAPPAGKSTLAERIDRSLSEQSAAEDLRELKPDPAAEQARRDLEMASAAAKRNADEAALQAKRRADDAAAEVERRAAHAAAADVKRKADADAEQAKRQSDAENRRKAEAAAAEAKRRADDAAALAEAKRKAEEAAAEASRRARIEADQARLKAQAEANRKAAEAAADAKLRAEQAAAEAARREEALAEQADLRAKAEAKREADEAAARKAEEAAAEARDRAPEASSERRKVDPAAHELQRDRKPAERDAIPSEKVRRKKADPVEVAVARPSSEPPPIPKSSIGWVLLPVGLLIAAVAYFFVERLP